MRRSRSCGYQSSLTHHLSRLAPYPVVDNGRNFEIVQLQMCEVTIPMNADVAQQDPVWLSAHLLQICDNAMIICYMRTGFSGKCDKWYTRNVGQGPDR